jgi:hypothetical protein
MLMRTTDYVSYATFDDDDFGDVIVEFVAADASLSRVTPSSAWTDLLRTRQISISALPEDMQARINDRAAWLRFKTDKFEAVTPWEIDE